jgi:hypothetical protein
VPFGLIPSKRSCATWLCMKEADSALVFSMLADHSLSCVKFDSKVCSGLIKTDSPIGC